MTAFPDDFLKRLEESQRWKDPSQASPSCLPNLIHDLGKKSFTEFAKRV